jgi:hypothetical protein
MREGIGGLLVTIAICAAVVAVVFGALGALIGLEFATTIAYIAAEAFVLSIYASIVMWVIGFDWSEMLFAKAAGAGVLMSALSYIVFSIFEWAIFYTLFVIFAVIAAIAIVVGVLKTIFE